MTPPDYAETVARADDWLTHKRYADISSTNSEPTTADAYCIIHDLLTIVRQQREVVERLPVTADGVPCAGDMDLWAVGTNGVIYEIKCNPYGLWVKDCPEDTEWDMHEHCYSTREAALAERGEGDE